MNRKDRSITNTSSPGADKLPQPTFKEFPYNQPETADKVSKFRSIFNNRPPGSVERVARQKLVSSSTFFAANSAMSRNETSDRPTSKPYRCYQDKSYPKAENEDCASATYTISKLNKGTDKCSPTAERIYTPTYKQLLVNCLMRDANLLTIRDFINGTLNKELAAAIDNEMTVELVSDEVAQKVHMIARQEG